MIGEPGRALLLSQILTTPGVALAGPLPPEIQSTVTFTAAVGAHAAGAP